ncbi:hypothetical protein NUU61_006099 [Penicillium alfredii]|uniref:Glucose-methanol-choline oxidoreductase N-terminal domain-containing protein n=1 Tax=Penicillium alfredii TaxID=1506179 RepID=A0A9W9K302_9EURO|nr:uncharacterized protein NUU61_006099 [Penicillium alfredii]KAJ5091229.1 hypothetical protein NUU61_006099 [Penicillium alfredii]
MEISLTDGRSRTFSARKEIIISGGAYCSPAILLRSGIGPREEVDRHGIPCMVDSPGVDKNLMDHLTRTSTTTTNATYKQWQDYKNGFLSTFPFGSFAFARLDEHLKNEPLWQNAPRQSDRDPMGLTPKQPNIEFFTTECYSGPKQYNQFPTNHQHAFSMIAELFAPKSRGSVTLHSADPLDNPVVDCNYMADPLDLLVLNEVCRFGNEVVMPVLHGGHTQMPAYGIGEKCTS